MAMPLSRWPGMSLALVAIAAPFGHCIDRATPGPVDCTQAPTTLHLSSPPYENYFYSDCHSASQVVVTSPLPDSNLTVIGPRLLVAWPAGNSGVAAFFAPQNGINGSLAVELVNSTSNNPLRGVCHPPPAASSARNPVVGVSTLVRFNSSAVLDVSILGSIRTVRDFTEGPSILVPEIQNAIKHRETDAGGAEVSRLWLDNITTTRMTFSPEQRNGSRVQIKNGRLVLEPGTYNFTASFDYPQLSQLNAADVLDRGSRDLIELDPDSTTALSFLSYTSKITAGAWRFLTYFGRDSMIALLLLEPVLSKGEGGAFEAVIGAVLERINSTDGTVCHEETIGDYATYLNQQNNLISTAAGCSYVMIDTDYYLPVVMERHFLKSKVGRSRRKKFFQIKARLSFGAQGLSYAHLALINAEKIMRLAAPFAAQGGQKMRNLRRLEQDQVVGQWRDSTYGIGGGRIPFDVNTALVPAALRSIAALSVAGFYPAHPEWKHTAAAYAQVWEDETLAAFEVTVPKASAKNLVRQYASKVGYPIPSEADNITSDVIYHGLALEGNDNQAVVEVMNTDDCFRHFLLNTTNQRQLTSFINQTANHIRQAFPVGLSTPVGVLIANPAYGGDPIYAKNWTNDAYHGTVVWSWQLAMMAAGLQRQLGRCLTAKAPDFCADRTVHSNVLAAYNHLWDLIEANSHALGSELWSWQFGNGIFEFIDFGALPPPPGQSPTESNIRQLWSLTFLAVTRDKTLK